MPIMHQSGYGLHKFYNKILKKLKALHGKPQSIANGFATGAAVSFTPFVGFHALLSLIIAKIFKQSGTAALIGTIVGNPWTFPFIWYADLHFGRIFLHREDITDNIDFIAFFKELFNAVIMLDFDRFISNIYPVFLPMLVGCIPFCIVTWIIFSKSITKALLQKKSDGER